MSIAFLNLLRLSISASFIIIVILILRLIFKNAPRFIFCILYGIVAIRLIFPFSIESVFSLIPKTDNIENEIIQNTFSNNNFSIIQNNDDNEVNINNNDNTNDLIFTESKNEILIIDIIYLSITALILTYGIINYYRLKSQIVVSKKIKNNYYICDNIQVPFILGIIRPKIYVPSELKDPELAFVLCHENAHIKRHDNLWKPLGYILLSIYWFNPLMWIAYILFCKDIEIAADEKVIKELGEDSKKAYSETLLSYSTKNQKLITACPVAFGETGVKERIKSILNYKKPTIIIIVIALILCTIIAICFLTNPITDISNVENLSRDEIVNMQSEVDNGHYPWRLSAEETALEFMHNKYVNAEFSKVEANYINSEKAIITIIYDANKYILTLFKPIEKGNNGIWIIKEFEISGPNYNNIEVSELFKDVLNGKENFIFANNDTNIKDVPNLFNEDDLYTKIENYAVLDLDGDSENEIILYIVATSNDMGGLLILHQIDNKIYGYKTNYREITLLKEDGTFEYSDPTGIKESGIAKISNFNENGYSINKIAYIISTAESNTYTINNDLVSEEEFNSFINEQNRKKDVTWNK